MKVKVTRGYIAAGEPDSPDRCPIALALNGLGFDYAEVFCHEVNLSPCLEHIKLPRSARRFINKFDEGRKVKPFAFNLVF